MVKAPDAFRTISEVSEAMNTPAHVLRFWESKFSQIKPVKRAGGRRYYRPDDITLLAGIKFLLHEQGMTIKGAQKLLREKGVKHVAGLVASPIEGQNIAPEPRPDMPKIRVVRREEAPATQTTTPQEAEVEEEEDVQTSLFVDEPTGPLLDAEALERLTVNEAEQAKEARFFAADKEFDEDFIRTNASKIMPLIRRLEAVRDRIRTS